jgi:hypothetical protein
VTSYYTLLSPVPPRLSLHYLAPHGRHPGYTSSLAYKLHFAVWLRNYEPVSEPPLSVVYRWFVLTVSSLLELLFSRLLFMLALFIYYVVSFI